MIQRSRIHALLLGGLVSVLASVPGSTGHAELVRAKLEGVVTASGIQTQVGQNWSLSFVFDTSAPEVSFTAQSSLFAEFFNTGPVKVLRSLDFAVGDNPDFTIHLVDPVPSTESEVRIDIDNFDSKTFFLHIDDAALLPKWNGLQLDNFLLGLEDLIPGGYADGSDHLPEPDPTITFAEFTGFTQVRLSLQTAPGFIGTPTAFALEPVPELSVALIGAMAGVTLLLLRRSQKRMRSGA
jgi:hypothetical protein